MPPALTEAIRQVLTERRLPFELRRHPAASNAAQAAVGRAEPLYVGGKALLIRVRKEFALFGIRSSLKLDSRKVKQRFGTTNTRFATRDELLEWTGLRPGAVPPLGPPVLPFPLYLDTSLTRGARVAFTPGLHDHSILMATSDFLQAADPEGVFPFAADPE